MSGSGYNPYPQKNKNIDYMHLLEIFSGHDTKEITEGEKKEDNLWSKEALAELNKVPGPFRSKARRGVEKYAKENNISSILVETMYSARESA